MILTCPSCTTRYTVDEAKFPAAGRTVRCAKCGHSWHQAAPEPEPVPEPEIAPAPTLEPEAAPVAAASAPVSEPESRLEDAFAASSTRAYAPQASAPDRASRTPNLQTAAVVAGWVGLVAVVLLIGYSAVRYRQDITAIWPQSAGVYSGLGLPVNSSGINFKDVAYRRESEDGQPVLVVTGRIVNEGARELPLPQTVRVGLTDADEREIYHWTFKLDTATLKPGAAVPFRTRLSSPPAAAQSAVITFARD